MDNIEAHDGDFAVCNMCMCEEFESYGGNKTCGADPVLHACYLSDTSCEYMLRKGWIIGFSVIGVVYCAFMVVCCYFCTGYKKEQRISPYRASNNVPSKGGRGSNILMYEV
jgi:hypothetical protein